jgi:hypothetical protein
VRRPQPELRGVALSDNVPPLPRNPGSGNGRTGATSKFGFRRRCVTRSGVNDRCGSRTARFFREHVQGPKVRCRRVSPVARRPREGRLTEPTAGTQPWPQERVLMPHCGHCLRGSRRVPVAESRPSGDPVPGSVVDRLRTRGYLSGYCQVLVSGSRATLQSSTPAPNKFTIECPSNHPARSSSFRASAKSRSQPSPMRSVTDLTQNFT